VSPCSSDWSPIDDEVLQLTDTKAMMMQPSFQEFAFEAGQRAIPSVKPSAQR
jgi:hypothetical protein